MTKFNDINMDNWKESEVWTDSLWLIDSRDNSGKHCGFYHGNFVPQIPRQLMLRYTKKGDIVFDPFVGSGTTAFVAEELERNIIGVDIQPDLVSQINNKLDNRDNEFSEIVVGDSSSEKTLNDIKQKLNKHRKDSVQFAILHPPYGDIIKFSDDPNDLSNTKGIDDFRVKFSEVLKNTVEILDRYRYLAIVIGDKYTAGEWVPLGFYCMEEAQKLGLKLKSIVVKNMSGNRAKQNKEGIWKYRALSSDYYIFKHEYIMIFKKEK
jgi:DNA modification methylase